MNMELTTQVLYTTVVIVYTAELIYAGPTFLVPVRDYLSKMESLLLPSDVALNGGMILLKSSLNTLLCSITIFSFLLLGLRGLFARLDHLEHSNLNIGISKSNYRVRIPRLLEYPLGR